MFLSCFMLLSIVITYLYYLCPTLFFNYFSLNIYIYKNTQLFENILYFQIFDFTFML